MRRAGAGLLWIGRRLRRQKGASTDHLRGAWGALHDRMGAFQRAIDEQSVVPQPGITALVLGSQFEKGAANIVVAFDSDKKIAGIQLAPRP